jgi:hypothetical protein
MANERADRVESKRMPWVVWALVIALAILSIAWYFQFPW